MSLHVLKSRRCLLGNLIAVFFVLLAGFAVVMGGVLTGRQDAEIGLSGLVSVKGTVSLSDLELSTAEVSSINTVVDRHRDTFTRVILTIDVQDGVDRIERSTVLAWSMALVTNGNCEVRSWNRTVKRDTLVKQMVSYVNKAAREYTNFKRYPDIEQNFKTLYI
ncbi:hypothetical protein GO013_03935 [Pseudodesulfovibrio sp. JC047]|uniref:hypothetical protein n=1 Tax=Pseudodesulfovibrio sp. JC047 TaxID=2683199 RepID=UPI0013D04ACF|nr:hypothetical protein [Pseudodesulfovibrio sp. JC047]NDV18569.1 hypothetical protein [Pseudodesulfovibrio sp. JC047]